MENKQKGHGFFRKNKAYGLVCGIALAGTLFLGTSTVLADENGVNTTNTVSTATNLSEPQAETSTEHLELDHHSNQSTGELTTPIVSDELNKTVEEAKSVGVEVTTTETVTHNSYEEAKVDLAKQSETITTIIEKQKANTVEITEAVEHNKAIDKQNQTEAERVDILNQKNQADIEAKNKAKEIATKKENDEAKKQAELENNRLKAEYDEAVKLREETIVSNSQLEAEYQRQLEAYNRKKAEYDEAVKLHEETISSNSQLEAEYQRQLEAYNRKKAEYDEAVKLHEEAKNRRLDNVLFDIKTGAKGVDNLEYGNSIMEATASPDGSFVFNHDMNDGVQIIGYGKLIGKVNHRYVPNSDGSITAFIDSITINRYEYRNVAPNSAVNQNIVFRALTADGQIIFEKPHNGNNTFTVDVNKTTQLGLEERLEAHQKSRLFKVLELHDDWVHDTHGWALVSYTNNNDVVPDIKIPQPPTPPTPPTPEVVPSQPEAPTPPTPPTPEVIPPAPIPPKEVVPVLKTFTPEKYTPVEPKQLPHIKVPQKKVYKVDVHGVEVKQFPKNSKDVLNLENISIDGHLIPKASRVRWELSNDNLKAGRESVTEYLMTDPLPNGFEVDDSVLNKLNETNWVFSRLENNKLEIRATDNLLSRMNSTPNVDFIIPKVLIEGYVLNDNAVYPNTFKTLISTPSGQYTVVSNTPKVKTPTPPTPEKHNFNKDDILIDGKVVLPNEVNYYLAKWDIKPYANVNASKEMISKGFAYLDDYQDDALVGLEDKFEITDASGNKVNGLKMYHVLSLETTNDMIKNIVKKSNISPQGAFYLWVAETPEEFYKAYIQSGKDIFFHLPMSIREGFVGTYTNSTYQIDFGNGYYSNIVENEVPKLEVEKSVKQNGEDKNNKEIALHETFTYELTHVTLPANRSEKLFQYDFKDDYDETGDKYTGNYKVTAKVDFTYTDEKGQIVTVKKGDDLTPFTKLTDKDGLLMIMFNQSFLESVSLETEFGAVANVEFKRIAVGTFENTFVGIVNGNEVISNTVKTTTPEPPKPKKERVLPKTGDSNNSILAIIVGIMSFSLGVVGIKKNK
ncbi:LPXTG cell wall anchor domain-containing protein [Streptococcus canis]|uniref:SspB-related isopeptide-forming adhesin n=1 Tax=Streptococcus canis TaxID=1329 RepID=UPI002948F3D0|nr:SspB-related isopeptide-forming adhesin [Streptococcus canis]MDV5987553.1 LPXTG cell wall anchor domain-containing protein [Streptococcus canis]